MQAVPQVPLARQRAGIPLPGQQVRVGNQPLQIPDGPVLAGKIGIARLFPQRLPVQAALRIQSCTPCWEGMRPVRMEARAGLHTGEAQKKFSNRVPCAASRSRLGVWMSVLPAQRSAQAPWSSVRINSRLGSLFHRLASLFYR